MTGSIVHQNINVWSIAFIKNNEVTLNLNASHDVRQNAVLFIALCFKYAAICVVELSYSMARDYILF